MRLRNKRFILAFIMLGSWCYEGNLLTMDDAGLTTEAKKLAIEFPLEKGGVAKFEGQAIGFLRSNGVDQSFRKKIIAKAIALQKEEADKKEADKKAADEAKKAAQPAPKKLVIPGGLQPGGSTSSGASSGIATAADVANWVSKYGAQIVKKLHDEEGITNASAINFDVINRVSGGVVKQGSSATMPPPPPPPLNRPKGKLPLPTPPVTMPPPPPPPSSKKMQTEVLGRLSLPLPTPPVTMPPPPPPFGKVSAPPTKVPPPPKKSLPLSSPGIASLTVDTIGAADLVQRIQKLFEATYSSSVPSQSAPSGTAGKGTLSPPPTKVPPPPTKVPPPPTGKKQQPVATAVDVKDALRLASRLSATGGPGSGQPLPPSRLVPSSGTTQRSITTAVDVRDALRLASRLSGAGSMSGGTNAPIAPKTLEELVQDNNVSAVEQMVLRASDREKEALEAFNFALHYDQLDVAIKMLEMSSKPQAKRILKDLQVTGLDNAMRSGSMTVVDAINQIENIHNYEESHQHAVDWWIHDFEGTDNFEKHNKQYNIAARRSLTGDQPGFNKLKAESFVLMINSMIQDQERISQDVEDLAQDVTEGLKLGMFKDDQYMTLQVFKQRLPHYQAANKDYVDLMKKFESDAGLNKAEAEKLMRAANFLGKDGEPEIVDINIGLEKNIFTAQNFLTRSQLLAKVPALDWYNRNMMIIMNELEEYVRMELRDDPAKTLDELKVSNEKKLEEMIGNFGLREFPSNADAKTVIDLLNDLIDLIYADEH